MAEAVVTFEEARNRHLKKLKEQFFRLHEIVADTQWCNPTYPPYKDALDAIRDTTRDIGLLNAAEQECQDLPA